LLDTLPTVWGVSVNLGLWVMIEEYGLVIVDWVGGISGTVQIP
jgi:hypothetical protein